MSALSLKSYIRKSDKILTQNLDDDSIMANIDKGYYYGVSNTGKRIWDLVDEKHTVGEICQQLRQEYNVEPADFEAEVLKFIQELIDEELVSVV